MDLQRIFVRACLALAVSSVGCSRDRRAIDRKSSRGTAGAAGNPFANAAPVVDASSGSFSNATTTPSLPNETELDGGVECGRENFDVARRPADILLVLDRSGSMQDDVNGDSKPPSKWDLVVPSLQQVITATDDSVDWGLKLFPEGDEEGECSDASYPKDIAVDIAAHNAAAVNAGISASSPKGDGTPTSDAVNEAVTYLKTLGDDNPKYILLATDGEPSCAGMTKSSSQARPAAIDAVKNAADAGFHTFVVGIATTKSSAQQTLTDLAAAGLEVPSGMGYYLATTQAELVSALQSIAGAVATCLFQLSSTPPNPDHVGVFVGSTSIAKDTNSHDGWNYTSSDQTAIELYGPACDALMASGAGSVRVVFGCRSDPLF